MVNIKVAVRIRPFSQKEVNQKDEAVVETYDKSILVTNLKVPEAQNGDSRQRIRRFAVDFCYDPKYPESCTQESVYRDVGKEILDSMFDGYNACVLAYGHSASGKTYTMMGDEEDPGLTPRICQGLFRRMSEKTLTSRVRFNTVISFLEIYNERVRDLLVNDDSASTAGNNFSLRVREHPKLGPYVQDLSQHSVSDEESILEYLSIGNSRRSTAATENNIHSSRSHAVFTIRFKQCDELNFESELSSKVHLVDLAGSLQETAQTQVKKNERAGSSQSKTRLKEGANINKSLVTLGNVISALAESCETFVNPREQPVTKTWQPFVPYRDSVLTWLLKDTLGGNSNTIMIATVSPASSCLNETINTLRYAKRTKRIVNQPIINEDPKIRTIRELREEIEKLRSVILSLQVSDRNDDGSKISSSKFEKGGDIDETAVSKGIEESIETSNSEPVNGNIGQIENDAISGLDILPDGAGIDENTVETHSANNRLAQSANSFSSNVSKINDEKKTDVNGSVIDKLVRESQIYSGVLGSFPAVRKKKTNHGGFGVKDGVDFRCEPRHFSSYEETKAKKRRLSPYKTYKDNQFVLKLSRISKLRKGSRKQSNHRLRVYLKRECASLESLPKMLHRSRPDLIKGIAAHSKDGLPSTSSQSFTDVSGLSQSASENSLNSSGSVDSQENKSMKCWPEKKEAKFNEVMQKSTSRQSSIGDGSGTSTPTQIPKLLPKKRADKRSEIVAAVTTRLYATKKKPDPRMEALQTVEKDEDDDGELEELKLCKRARMKLFDLSRKLAMAKRIKKTADSDTQTDFASGTIRMKEKCISTDQTGHVEYETCSTNTDKPKKDKPIIMNQVFIPQNSNYIVECGKSVRVEVPVAMPIKYDSGTQTITLCKDQSTSPPNDDYFSDDSLEDGFVKWKKNYELDSLELCANPMMRKSSMKSQSNENFRKLQEPVKYRRSYDSLIDNKVYAAVDKTWLPITRYPIAGTNALYEYDPNKSAPDVIYNSAGQPYPPNEGKYQPKFMANEEPSKVRRTEIVLPLFNGLPLAVCTETVSSTENITEDTINFITTNVNRFLPNLQSEENASSENSLSSNDGSDITCSSETSSEDFVFYEGPKEKEPLNRQSGLGNLYTISENSELSDLTASDPSSPRGSQHSSLQALEQRREKNMCSTFIGPQNDNDKCVLNKDYSVGVHVLRNPMAEQETNNKDELHKLEDTNSLLDCSKSDPDQRIKITVSSPPEVPMETLKPAESRINGEPAVDDKCHQKQKKNHSMDKPTKKINWSDIQAQSQRQFLNFNILNSSKQTPFTIDSNIFSDKKTSEAKFPSEDSITFVFMGPNRQKTSMLMEIIKRTLGHGSDASISEKSHRKSRNRGVQCKLMRSVSVDTAMIALSRFAKHQRPIVDITRTSSLDTLVPEEMQTILEQGRLHGIRENGCQCDIKEVVSDSTTSPNMIKYAICTSTTRDQGTETDKSLDTAEKYSMTSSLVDASCDALEESEDNLFDEYFPPLPRTKLSACECHNGMTLWKDIKDVILGTAEYLKSTNDEEEKPKRPRKAKKSVSWSDLSEYEEIEETERSSDAKMTDSFDESLRTSEKSENSYFPVNQKDVLDYRSPSLETRRVRFIEPQRTCVDEICHILEEKKEVAETAANVTAFLKEAVQLLKNLNHLSKIYDITEGKKNNEEGCRNSSLKRVETSVQTDGLVNVRPKDISLSADSSPVRRVRTSSALAERRDKKASLNLTWPRQRPTSSSNIPGKPPTGLKYTPSLKSSRLSYRSPCPSLDFKRDLESSSTSTNWNISNLSTNLSNSYFGDSGCSRPSSSKSFYSDGNRVDRSQWSRSSSKVSSPRLPKIDPELEMDLEDSCRRLELAVERDKLREENSNIKLSTITAKKYVPMNWYFNSSDTETEDGKGRKIEESNFKCSFQRNKVAEKTSLRRRHSSVRKKPCKCYCHYRTTNRVYRSSLELEAQPPVERHCHACCTPCETTEPERSCSAPALNSICDSEDNKCRLFYYGYCPCSPVKLKHIKSSPRAYMQHLLSLRRQIVKNTYDSV